MAVIHTDAQLQPSKQEMLESFVADQSWWPAGLAVPAWAASFRFDDPDGDVGLETFLLPVDGGWVQVPLTYRGAPLDGGALAAETEHSVLGHRWVYDGPSDPVWVAETTAVIQQGRGDVAMVRSDGTWIDRRPTMATVKGSGSGSGRLELARHLPATPPADATGTLTGTWPGQESAIALAWLVEA